ncbi:ACP S-malonyltransferase [Fictibacillus iocasae]|uniref:Malonyl CoA-acyl carrier protein transacylase n=1 Tax=Fictibacillus iocasae TaxID=2715437 RepID=A0ABW2NND5_9BACL
MGKTAFLFPGQGSQFPGMGKELAKQYAAASDVFQKADQVLGFSLSELMFHGPEEELKRTENTQPALLTMSTAVAEVLKENGITFDYAAGHSLGEYSALVAANSLLFEEAVYCVRQRGKFMEEAVPSGLGSMAAVLGMEQQLLESITAQVTKEGDSVQIANLNCPGQIVISGTASGVDNASLLVKEQGAKVIPLQVSGPFHSVLMKPAAEKFRSVLEKTNVSDASVGVVANVTAKPVTDRHEIKELLVEQLFSPVRWEETIRELMDLGVDTFVEAGPGKVLSGLVKKVNRRANVYAVSDPETLAAVIEKLKGEKEHA